MIHEFTGHMSHGLAESLLDKQPHWLTNTVTDSSNSLKPMLSTQRLYTDLTSDWLIWWPNELGRISSFVDHFGFLWTFRGTPWPNGFAESVAARFQNRASCLQRPLLKHHHRYTSDVKVVPKGRQLNYTASLPCFGQIVGQHCMHLQNWGQWKKIFQDGE